MADSVTFEKTCAELVQGGALDQLSARGTIRIVLKNSGLDAKTVSPEEMIVVIEKLLPAELVARGIAQPDSVCQKIASALARLPKSDTPTASPETVFARLGGAS